MLKVIFCLTVLVDGFEDQWDADGEGATCEIINSYGTGIETKPRAASSGVQGGNLVLLVTGHRGLRGKDRDDSR